MANARAITVVVFLLAGIPLAGCARDVPARAESVDDFGDTVRVAAPGQAPGRVVSLNPTTTQIIFAIGAGGRLVGRSSYDLSPDSAKLVPSLGDAIRPNVEVILAAHPDLVLLYASQDNRAAANRLREAGINTLSLKIDRIADFRRAVMTIGRVLGDTARAGNVRDSVARSLDRVARLTTGLKRPTVFWHIWDEPLITIGRGSFMTELVNIAGGKNVYDDLPQAGPTVSLEDVSRRNPDFILAGPEGARRILGDSHWRVVRAARPDDVLIVDTALVGNPSVRLGEAARSLAKLLHPGTIR